MADGKMETEWNPVANARTGQPGASVFQDFRAFIAMKNNVVDLVDYTLCGGL